MAREQPLVHTKLGALRGKIDIASDGQEYFTFHGIPYAQPPIGDLRFKAPRSPKSWTGILDTTVESDECYSKHQAYMTPVGSEDCLKLNVYTHSITNGDKKPVMLWIHGGGFTTGSNKVEAYGPDFFMCEDIVLVTINYRLGIFGFLSIKDKSLGVPGNAGLKDQVMALKWVQDNIEFFGGDPNNVTAFGESAGGASVHYLLCSPMARGLFHKVIMQSGSALNHWARGQFLPGELFTHFNMEGKSEAEILTKLMSVSKEELLVAQYKCRDVNRVSDLRPFAPVIEGFNPYEHSFLMEDPLDIMLSGNYIKVPMITGYNTHEGMLFDAIESKAKVSLLITNFDHAVPYKYLLPKGSDMLKLVGEKLKLFYYGTSDPAKEESRKYFRNMQTDNFFLRGIYITLQTILASNPNPVYVYRFALDGQLNIYKQLADINHEGVCHGDDVFYMFKTLITPEVDPYSIEGKTIKRFIKFWTNFAKTSNPNPAYPDDLIEIQWPKTDGMKLLNIGEKLEVIDFPEINRMTFWDKIDRLMNKL